MKTAKSLIFSVIGFGLMPVLGFAGSLLSARLLGPAGRGELTAIMTTPMLLCAVAFLGTTQSLTFFTAQDKNRSGEFLGSALLLTLCASIPATIIALVIQYHSLTGYRPEVITTAFIFTLFIPLNVLNAAPWGIFQGQKSFGLLNALRLQPQILYVIIIACAFFAKDSSSTHIALLYLITTLAICVPSTWIAYSRRVKQRLQANSATIRQILPFGLYSLLNYLPNALNQRVDLVFVAAWLSSAELGLYSVASSLVVITLSIPMAIGSVAFPEIASQPPEQARNTLAYTIRWSLLLILTTATVLFLATPTLISVLFSERFVASIPSARILILASIFLSLNAIFADGFRGLGRPKIPVIAEIAALVVTICGLTLFLRRFGIIGAAYVSAASYFVSLVVYLYFFFTSVASPLSGWPKLYREESSIIRAHIAVVWSKLLSKWKLA